MERAAEPFDPDVAGLADVARQFGHHAGRLCYSGVVPDHENRAVTVYRVPNRDFDSEIRALLAGDVAVRLADAPHTRDALLVAREQVWGLADALPILSVTVPADGTRLSVVADAPGDEVQAALDLTVPGLATVLVEHAATP
jgi:hypothetical protein